MVNFYPSQFIFVVRVVLSIIYTNLNSASVFVNNMRQKIVGNETFASNLPFVVLIECNKNYRVAGSEKNFFLPTQHFLPFWCFFYLKESSAIKTRTVSNIEARPLPCSPDSPA